MAIHGDDHLSITAFCQSCGTRQAFDPSAVGRQAKCSSCGFVFTVPDTRPPEPPQIVAFCQGCGAEHSFDAHLVGRKAKCEKCGYEYRLPDTRPQKSSTADGAFAGRRTPDVDETPQAERPLPPPGLDAADLPLADLEDQAEPYGISDPVPDARPNHSDPLDALAASEIPESRPAIIKNDAPPPTASQAVIARPEVNPETSVTVFSILLAMFLVTMIIISVIVLEHLVGIVLTVWILLPVVAVYGIKILSYLAFLLTGKSFTRSAL